MDNKIKFVHTNIVARNWKELAQFYMDVFNCEPFYPERDLSGKWVDDLTNLPKATIKGIHLKLPGYEDGPSLEIFEYNPSSPINEKLQINDCGFGHIAFHVENVEEVMQKFIRCGGKKYGDLIEKEIPGVGVLKAIYMSDPEGNIVEIQNWSQQ